MAVVPVKTTCRVLFHEKVANLLPVILSMVSIMDSFLPRHGRLMDGLEGNELVVVGRVDGFRDETLANDDGFFCRFQLPAAVRGRVLPVRQPVPHGSGTALPERRLVRRAAVVERRAELLVLVSAGLLGVAVRDPRAQRVRRGAVPPRRHLPAAHARQLHVRLSDRLPRTQVRGRRPLRPAAVQERRPVQLAGRRLPLHLRARIHRPHLRHRHRRVQEESLLPRTLQQHARILQVSFNSFMSFIILRQLSKGCTSRLGATELVSYIIGTHLWFSAVRSQYGYLCNGAGYTKVSI